MPPLLVAVMGQTASGKTGLAEAFADRMDAALINADAFQAYRGMDIGTAKPEAKERYRLLDIKRPDEPYGVGEFCLRAAEELNALYAEGRSAIVVGGTGQYVRALFEEYRDLMPEPDPELRARLTGRLEAEGLAVLAEELKACAPEIAASIDLQNPARVTRALERFQDVRKPLSFQIPYQKRIRLPVIAEKAEVEDRIARRVGVMMHNGWVEEVRRLLDEGFGPGDPGFKAIGYRTVAALIDEDLATEEAERAIIQETIAYAKRQRTWLRSEPGLQIAVPGTPAGLEEAWSALRAASLEM